jgi:hypothetical protein
MSLRGISCLGTVILSGEAVARKSLCAVERPLAGLRDPLLGELAQTEASAGYSARFGALDALQDFSFAQGVVR